ncbi:carbonic anhydrase-like protein [Leptomonas seymouri]|uniref:carbonic anhydrase n=1 Tax=Leptomonas seymouri TaxID=5684 RepID=A0A0N1PBI8_LEPSE|nr:carbonic anhydrase-like protein [Leptomonas seymouri]|eukprot:KPI85408.1 carbonic anhydrase-like protein [Leptomonas seymouri]
MRSSTSTCACLSAVVLLLAAVFFHGAASLPYHEGNYGTAGLPHADLPGSKSSWDYTNLDEWPELCRTGSRQSPISFSNVDPKEVVKDAPLRRLQFSSKCFFPKGETQMRIVNEGAVSMVRFERQGHLAEDLSECFLADPLNKSRIFYFSELHFHATSEHKFRSLRPDVEMHLSFVTDEQKERKREVLTVAVMLKASNSINSTSVRALRHILVDGSLPRRHAMTTCFLTEDVSITSLLPARESYLMYDGSETHPPCRENVRWVVMTSPVFISRAAVGKLRDAMDQLLPNDFHRFGNTRPPQALNGRRIYRFDDTSVPQGRRHRKGELDDAWAKKAKRSGAGVVGIEAGAGDILHAQGTEPTSSAFADLDSYGDDVLTTSSSSAEACETTMRPTAATDSPTPALMNATTDTESDSSDSSISSSAASSTTENRVNWAAQNTTKRPYNRSTSADSLAAPKHNTHAHNSTASSRSAEETASAANSTSGPTKTSNNSTSTLPSTTQRPATRKGKKGRESVSKNISETAADSGNATSTVGSIKSATSSSWARLRNFFSRSVSTARAYIKEHPGKAVIAVLIIIAFFFLMYKCICGWTSPVYVVGIDPRELQPLNRNSEFGQYGGTGDAAVHPVSQPPV